MSQNINDEIHVYENALENLLKNGVKTKDVKPTAKNITDKLRSKIQDLLKNGFSILEICNELASANSRLKARSFYAYVSQIRREIREMQKNVSNGA